MSNSITRIHINNAAHEIRHKLQDLRETFTTLAGPDWIVYDDCCMFEMQLKIMILEADKLIARAGKVLSRLDQKIERLEETDNIPILPKEHI